MKKLLLSTTGGGKTYHAMSLITEAQKKGKKCLALFPCRQLAYEVYLDYGKQLGASLNTGEVHIEGDNPLVKIAVYESGYGRDFDFLFVDEAHFVGDNDRGHDLACFIEQAVDGNKDVVLATATNSISDEWLNALGIVPEELTPFCTAPKKIELSSKEEFYKNVHTGMASIYFSKYTPSEYDLERICSFCNIPTSQAVIMHSGIKSYERLEAQMGFMSGKYRLIISTNVLAQGLNFPAQQVLIEYNSWDDPEIVQQKIGRIGRPKKMNGDKCYYYALSIDRVEKKKKAFQRAKTKCMYKRFYLIDHNKIDVERIAPHEVPKNFNLYSDYKYGYKFLKNYTHLIKDEYKEEAQLALADLQEQELKLKILLTQ